MARDERAEAVAGAEGPRGAGSTGASGERSQLAVGHDLTARDGTERDGAVAVEPVVEVELHIREVVGLAGKERGQAGADRGFHGGSRTDRDVVPDASGSRGSGQTRRAEQSSGAPRPVSTSGSAGRTSARDEQRPLTAGTSLPASTVYAHVLREEGWR